MSDPVLEALRRNLANSDAVSQADKVKRIQARIDKLEKAATKPEPAPKSVTTTTTTVSNLAAPKGKK